MHKNMVESIKDENRKLSGEHQTIKRALDNSEKLLASFEKENFRLDREIQKLVGPNVNKYQNALVEAELHR